MFSEEQNVFTEENKTVSLNREQRSAMGRERQRGFGNLGGKRTFAAGAQASFQLSKGEHPSDRTFSVMLCRCMTVPNL